jgi:hypothetical protein
MFVGSGKPRKPRERARARELRSQGWSYKRIASALRVSPSSALHWTRDIQLTPEQVHQNIYGPRGPQNPEHIAKRTAAIRATAMAQRISYQQQGRAEAMNGNPLHLAGCMLYWAEGAKEKNRVKVCNSDLAMLVFFRRFLTDCFDVEPDRIAFSLHVYLGNDLSLRQIEDHWLGALELPRSCLRKHAINPLPTSSSGQKRNRLPYGVGTLSHSSTAVVQHIFGAIQEYAGFDEPRWLG